MRLIIAKRCDVCCHTASAHYTQTQPQHEEARIWRHGDVLIATVDAIPMDADPRPGTTLAYGEITGHSRRIQDPDSARLWTDNGLLFLQVIAPTATVVHEEHRPSTLPRGTYCVWMQREYTPREIRAVID